VVVKCDRGTAQSVLSADLIEWYTRRLPCLTGRGEDAVRGCGGGISWYVLRCWVTPAEWDGMGWWTRWEDGAG
jgi:hypothetical protein